LKEEYRILGKKILYNVLKRTNRLISFARNIKGQYWLLEYQLDMSRMSSLFCAFKAVGKIDGRKKFSFNPHAPNYITVIVQSDERYIKEYEWGEVCEFVGNEQRVPLVLELLAGSEQLAANGYKRAALTEAVTALEVALFNFARSHKDNNKLSQIMGSRMSVPNLTKQIEHMGLSGSVNYLLPVILPDDVLPEKVLRGCQDAIKQRQNVVHNGSRNVDNLQHYISCIRRCCQILIDFLRE